MYCWITECVNNHFVEIYARNIFQHFKPEWVYSIIPLSLNDIVCFGINCGPLGPVFTKAFYMGMDMLSHPSFDEGFNINPYPKLNIGLGNSPLVMAQKSDDIL